MKDRKIGLDAEAARPEISRDFDQFLFLRLSARQLDLNPRWISRLIIFDPIYSLPNFKTNEIYDFYQIDTHRVHLSGD